MNFTELYKLLKERFDNKILGSNEANIDPFIVVEPSALVEIMHFLKVSEETRFDFLSCISGVDYPEEQIIEVVYHLFSYSRRGKLSLKVRLPRENPVVESVTSVWKSADWLEREVYDLFGVKFTGHLHLRRILLPEDWEGHPLRKDYVEPIAYHGIKNK